MFQPLWPPSGEWNSGEGCDFPIGKLYYIDAGFQVLQPIVGDSVIGSVSSLDSVSEVGERWHLAKSQLPSYYWWIVELETGCIPSGCEVGKQNSGGDYFFHAACAILIVSPRVKLDLEWVFIILVIIMVWKLDGGVFSKPNIEAFEEIGCAKDVRVIGNHYSSFTKEVHRRVTISSPSANSSEGKVISFRLIPIVRCIYMLSHNWINYQGPPRLDIGWSVLSLTDTWWSKWYTDPRRCLPRGIGFPSTKVSSIFRVLFVRPTAFYRK